MKGNELSNISTEFEPGYRLEIWDLQDIANHVHMPINSVRRLVGRDGFPNPIGNVARNRRWISRDVKAHFEEVSKTPKYLIPRISIDSTYQPQSIVFKN